MKFEIIIKLVCIKSLPLKLTIQPQRRGRFGMSVAQKNLKGKKKKQKKTLRVKTELENTEGI